MQDPHALPLFRHPDRGRQEAAFLADFPLEARIVVVLAQQPWAAAADLANRLGVPDVYEVCAKLEEDGLIAGRELGVTRRRTRRYVLARKGVQHVTRPFDCSGLIRAELPLTWQMTEAGVTRMLLWLPMIESLYEILPTFWTGGVARPFEWQSSYSEPSCSSYVWLGVPALKDVRWLSAGRLHVETTWDFERPGRRPRTYRIPASWTGLLPQEDFKARSLRLGSQHLRSPRFSQDPITWDMAPPLMAIGTDGFAAWRARWAYGDDVTVGSVDTAGALVWSAEASHSGWIREGKLAAARSIGHPEAATIEEGPDIVNLGGVREYRFLCFLGDFRAATRANLAKAFHMSGSSVKAASDFLGSRDLVTNSGRNLYLTQKGVDLVAARDRIDRDRLVEVTYDDPDGADAKRERHHDSAAAEVAAEFLARGLAAVAGWRWVVSWKDGQLVPDLWVLVPVPGRPEGIWVAVEIEFSAKARARIEEKLRSYRLARIRLGQTFPILVITDDKLPAQRFDDQAGDLIIFTTTLKELRTGAWEGTKSVWRRKGCPVDLNSIAAESYPHLGQQQGHTFDYSRPTGEDFEKLFIRESISVDTQPELFESSLAPMSPQLQAETDRVLNEITGGTPVTKPAPAPAPAPVAPTPPPEPVRTPATTPDPALQRRRVLSKIDPLVAAAYEIAGRRLQEADISTAERLCLQRVKAIINYGMVRHHKLKEPHLAEAVQQCLRLDEQNTRETGSGTRLWLSIASPAQTEPQSAFRKLLDEYPDTRRDSCRLFNSWFNMASRDVRDARRARTL